VVTVPKLYYWGFKARSFFPVCAASCAGVEIEWEQQPAWPELKPEAPFGQMPFVKHGDVTIAQTNAIARYFAKLGGGSLLGSSDADFGISEMLIEESSDLTMLLIKAHYGNGEGHDRAAGYNNFFQTTLPPQLAHLEKLVHGNKFTGELVLGEVAIYCNFNIIAEIEPSFLDATPNLKAFYTRMHELEPIKKVHSTFQMGIYFQR